MFLYLLAIFYLLRLRNSVAWTLTRAIENNIIENTDVLKTKYKSAARLAIQVLLF